MQYPIKYIENNLVWNHDGECFAYYELIPYNYSFLSVEQKEAVHDAFRQLIAQNRDGKIHALQISTESSIRAAQERSKAYASGNLREAGLRLPRPLGHAVSIVGALVIGETAVNAGLIGAPTLMVVALTAISSYVIPDLYPPVAILRILFIIAGGIGGVWGIVLLFCVVLVNICGKLSFGVPYVSPVAPFSLFGMRDVLIRAGWKTLSKKRNFTQDQRGSEQFKE